MYRNLAPLPENSMSQKFQSSPSEMMPKMKRKESVSAPKNPETFDFPPLRGAAMEEAPTVDATAGFSARPELNFSSAVVGKRVEGVTE